MYTVKHSFKLLKASEVSCTSDKSGDFSPKEERNGSSVRDQPFRNSEIEEVSNSI